MSVTSTGGLETLLGRMLRSGVISSTSLLAAGLLLQLTAGATAPADWLTRAGLIVLMATPVARVAASVAGFLVRKGLDLPRADGGRSS